MATTADGTHGTHGTETAARVAVVIGGSRGIGRAIVERLTRDGLHVVFSYATNEQAAKEVLEAVRTHDGEARALQADLARLDQVRALFDEAERRYGRLDVCVCNAATGRLVTIADATEEDYDAVMGANAKGTFFAMQEAARRLREGGRIVNLSTLNTVLAAPSNALYQGSKGAIEQFTRVAARELGARGITVNAVAPGATDTDLLRSMNPPESLASIPRLTPLGRLGTPEDIARVVAFLVGPDSGWITGQVIFAGGGIV